VTAFAFAVVSPERRAFEGSANQVSLRTAGGDIGLLAGHVPYIGAVSICPCEVTREDGGVEVLAVHGGFLEADPEGAITLLADVVEKAAEIDTARAQRARDAAAGRVAADAEDVAAAAALMRAEVRLAVAGAGG
jgi:F-type H+-transporting ATPase subunit epsilon